MAVKKKIRAIQYGIGSIGAAILKLMREKEAIEIIGAIDNDPAKIGKDLGEVVGADDAPWGGVSLGPDGTLLPDPGNDTLGVRQYLVCFAERDLTTLVPLLPQLANNLSAAA